MDFAVPSPDWPQRPSLRLPQFFRWLRNSSRTLRSNKNSGAAVLAVETQRIVAEMKEVPRQVSELSRPLSKHVQTNRFLRYPLAGGVKLLNVRLQGRGKPCFRFLKLQARGSTAERSTDAVLKRPAI